MKSVLIEVKKLSKIFEKKKGKPSQSSGVTALSEVDLTLHEGEIFGLIGPDGAGKTTFLRILAGLLAATEGSVNVLGLPLPGRAEEIRESLGYMSQKFSLYSDLSVEENLTFFADIHGIGKSELRRRSEKLYEMTRLGEFKDRPAGKLSGGMKQKLALMCTLLPRPRLLLLDEPTTGVDPISRREFWEILQSLLGEGVTILVSTPYMDEAEWCTKIGLLHAGRFLANDNPLALKQQIGVTILEGEIPDFDKDLPASLAHAPGVMDLHRLGGRVKITISTAEEARRIQESFQDRIRLEPVIPTVEDVFLKRIHGGWDG
jgi:ABC-2 type transport system ATP-binding protein